METTCPHCREPVRVSEEDHYSEVKCPRCGKPFQAFSETTQKLSREFLDQVLGRKPGGD